MSNQSDIDISWRAPLVTFERSPDGADHLYRNGADHLYRNTTIDENSICLPYNTCHKTYPIMTKPHVPVAILQAPNICIYQLGPPKHSPQPDNRRGAGLISQPQNTTQAKYFHLSFTHHILQPPRSNTTNTRHIDRFRGALHHVSNIELR